jgi:hypothetical protein
MIVFDQMNISAEHGMQCCTPSFISMKLTISLILPIFFQYMVQSF